MKRSFIFILVMILLVMTFTVPTYAAKKLTLKTYSYNDTDKQLKKKAKTVKVGTTELTLKNGIVKFTAKKNKKYKFIFSNLSGSNAYEGPINVCEYKYGTTMMPFNSSLVKTQGGKTYILNIGTQDAENHDADTDVPLVKRALTSRYAKIKLKKGQTIYFLICLVGTTGEGDYNNLTLKIE